MHIAPEDYPNLNLAPSASDPQGVQGPTLNRVSRSAGDAQSDAPVVGGPAGAAARLGLKRTTLAAKMQKLGIHRPTRRNEPEQFTCCK